MNQPASFLWYDYETWGIQPRRDGIAQFAAVRTDADLNVIGEPVDWKCQPLPDTVVSPDAALITGLNPADCAATGLSEWEFADRIQKLMAEPGSCVCGYNSIRFDDEFSRHLFYRNLLDPYSREWRNGNSRWDLLDVVRLTYALRPDGINWPTHDDGTPSFKLEHLTAANGIEHGNAHDAVSDVLATIELAKLIRRHQPKLFAFALELRDKNAVRRQLKFDSREPHLHVSGKIPAARGCLAVELPLIEHPDRRNEIIVLDLTDDPSWLLDHNADQVRDWLYTPTDALPDGIPRVPLRTLHLNRSPMVAPFAMLDDSVAERLNVDRDALARHRAIVDRWHDLVTLARDVYRSDERAPFIDPEHALYAGFIDDHDRGILNRIRASTDRPEAWPGLAEELHDDRQQTLVFNARARHFADSLSATDAAVWRDQVRLNLTDPDWGSSQTWQEAFDRTQELLNDEPESAVLLNVKDWLEQQKRNWLDDAKPTSKKNTDQAENANPDQTQLGLFD
ncbi:exodeoxyribonuclease I [Saccharospirillum mangrovi]|uniref:exodeoxyribonuclease I n=1 Tax=Saccharospirillum mangrovi TaxID=2161747 RepID=UPI000D35F485|nr:exodeoxyribonuclease I [Saccharospirillum mangrovi]